MAIAEGGSSLPCLILAGGSEIVAVSLADALAQRGVPLAIVALGRRSLLRGVQPGMRYAEVQWPPLDITEGLSSLLPVLRAMGAGDPVPWPVFATEDGGLRLLVEGRDALAPYLAIPGATALRYGGLDKGECFARWVECGLQEYVAPTVVLAQLQEVAGAIDLLGAELVLKPSLKPFAVNFGLQQAKVLARGVGEGMESFLARARPLWSFSPRWVAQPRLVPDEDRGEASWWGLRTRAGMSVGLTAFQRWKYPRIGGTACWVVLEGAPLHEIGAALLDAIGFVGVAEIEFLRDARHQWRAIEVNARPWLQVGLADRAGYPLVHTAYLDLAGEDAPWGVGPGSATAWVNAERLLLAALSGEQGPRGRALLRAMTVLQESDCRAGYDSRWPQVRRRWIARVIGTATRTLLRRR